MRKVGVYELYSDLSLNPDSHSGPETHTLDDECEFRS